MKTMPLDPGGDLRVGPQQQGDVGQRRQRDQGDPARRRSRRRQQDVAQQLDRMRPVRRGRAPQSASQVAHAVLAVDVPGVPGAAPAAAARHRGRPARRRHPPPPGPSGCCARPGRRGVAGDAADRPQVEPRVRARRAAARRRRRHRCRRRGRRDGAAWRSRPRWCRGPPAGRGIAEVLVHRRRRTPESGAHHGAPATVSQLDRGVGDAELPAAAAA